MRGQDKIIKMRKQGKRPAIIFINDTPELSVLSKEWHNPGEKYGEVWRPDHACVDILETDTVELLDLRFVTGCIVSISSGDEKRSKSLFDACKLAGAKVVAACHSIDHGGRITTGWCEVWRAN